MTATAAVAFVIVAGVVAAAAGVILIAADIAVTYDDPDPENSTTVPDSDPRDRAAGPALSSPHREAGGHTFNAWAWDSSPDLPWAPNRGGGESPATGMARPAPHDHRYVDIDHELALNAARRAAAADHPSPTPLASLDEWRVKHGARATHRPGA